MDDVGLRAVVHRLWIWTRSTPSLFTWSVPSDQHLLPKMKKKLSISISLQSLINTTQRRNHWMLSSHWAGEPTASLNRDTICLNCFRTNRSKTNRLKNSFYPRAIIRSCTCTITIKILILRIILSDRADFQFPLTRNRKTTKIINCKLSVGAGNEQFKSSPYTLGHKLTNHIWSWFKGRNFN